MSPNSDVLPDRTLWTRRRWAWTIAGIFVLHLLAIVSFPARPSLRMPEPNRETEFQMVLDPQGGQNVFEKLFVCDPMTFAVPNKDGFSGPAWLDGSKAEYNMPEWDEPPRWLEIPSERLGVALAEEMGQTSLLRASVAEALPTDPEISGPTAALTEITDGATPVRVEGDLVTRLIKVPSELPAWSHPEPLLETVVQAGVNAAGVMASARLLARSGSPAADDKALELARQTAFRATSQLNGLGELTWGKIIFHWRTLPVGTNATAAANQ
jgi:hypothetical protein